MKYIVSLFCALALGLGSLVYAQTRVPESRADIQMSFAPVVRASKPAVVNIFASQLVERRISPFADDPFFSQFFGRQGRSVPKVENALGSGVIVDPTGIVVSNHHVVGNAQDIRVVLSDRREYVADILLSDKDADLAILALRDLTQELPTLELADSDLIEVGDLVLAIGNPFGVGQTVTSGIVSGLARTASGLGSSFGAFIQTDAPINPGNSGGALVDMDGRLIGVNTAILTRSGGSNGIGFAIPSNLVRQYVAQAKDGSRQFRQPWIGARFQEMDPALAEFAGLDRPQGVMISQIRADSPLKEAGLEAGDVVLKVNGQEVNSSAEMDFRFASLGLGAAAEVIALRQGSEITADFTLKVAPADPLDSTLELRTLSPFQGLEAGLVTPRRIEQLDLNLEADGIVVLKVNGFARRVGLRPGDLIRAINGNEIKSLATLKTLSEQNTSFWDVEIERAGRQLSIRFRA